MSYFKAKMHQIQFRLGLRPRPSWVSLQHFPRPLAEFKGPTSKERDKGGKGRGREGREREGSAPPGSCLHPPWRANLDKTLFVTLFATLDQISRK